MSKFGVEAKKMVEVLGLKWAPIAGSIEGNIAKRQVESLLSRRKRT